MYVRVYVLLRIYKVESMRSRLYKKKNLASTKTGIVFHRSLLFRKNRKKRVDFKLLLQRFPKKDNWTLLFRDGSQKSHLYFSRNTNFQQNFGN